MGCRTDSAVGQHVKIPLTLRSHEQWAWARRHHNPHIHQPSNLVLHTTYGRRLLNPALHFWILKSIPTEEVKHWKSRRDFDRRYLTMKKTGFSLIYSPHHNCIFLSHLNQQPSERQHPHLLDDELSSQQKKTFRLDLCAQNLACRRHFRSNARQSGRTNKIRWKTLMNDSARHVVAAVCGIATGFVRDKHSMRVDSILFHCSP